METLVPIAVGALAENPEPSTNRTSVPPPLVNIPLTGKGPGATLMTWVASAIALGPTGPASPGGPSGPALPEDPRSPGGPASPASPFGPLCEPPAAQPQSKMAVAAIQV